MASLDVPAQPALATEVTGAGETRKGTHDDGLSAFMSVRPRLFGIALRILRNAAEAEDVVQDVWVRWQKADRTVVQDAAAFLATTATRLAINVMQSARSRREMSAGTSLPDMADTDADPRVEAERRQALASGILVLLERLSPTERAAYILRAAFDYPYREIAKVLRLAEANARQVVTRARRRLEEGRRTAASSAEQRHLLEAFIAAAQTGDVAGLGGTLRVGLRVSAQRVQIAPTDLTGGQAGRDQRAAA
jgi:RNA polymerase sigma-70 factor (ECF subfamily)